MGGPGSGRPMNVENILKRQNPVPAPNSMIIPNLSGDHTAGTTKTPVNDQDIVNKEYVDNIPVGSDITLYLNNTGSDIGTYYVLAPTIQTGTESSAGAVLSAAGTLIKEFATALGCECITNLATLVAGNYETHFHAASTKTGSRIYAKLYKRNAGGTETLLSTSEVSDQITLSKASYSIHFSLTTDTNWLSTDRVVVKYYGNPGTPSNPTTTIYMEGTTASRLTLKTTSFSRLHNELGNLDWANAGHPSEFSGSGVVATGTISGSHIRVTGDEETISGSYVANVVYGIGSTPPTVTDYTRGTIYVEYTP